MKKNKATEERYRRIEEEFLRAEKAREQEEKKRHLKRSLIEILGTVIVLILTCSLGWFLVQTFPLMTPGDWIFTFVTLILITAGLAVLKRRWMNRLKKRLGAE